MNSPHAVLSGTLQPGVDSNTTVSLGKSWKTSVDRRVTKKHGHLEMSENQAGFCVWVEGEGSLRKP